MRNQWRKPNQWRNNEETNGEWDVWYVDSVGLPMNGGIPKRLIRRGGRINQHDCGLTNKNTLLLPTA